MVQIIPLTQIQQCVVFFHFHTFSFTWEMICLTAKSCHTLWDPVDCSPPGSSVHGIFQERILELIAISFSKPELGFKPIASCTGRQILQHRADREAPDRCMCACMHAKSLQPCATLCDPMDCSPPGVSINGILQARILEWAAIPSSRGSSRPRNWTNVSYVSCNGWWVLYNQSHLGSLQSEPPPP